MACKTSYELHHNFPKLAEEAGFAFNTHRPKIRIDWNRIKLVDVESLIRDRKFVLLEQHLNDVLDCVLESEFDVRILDEGVAKMFRLAQLTVEYQQFCRHYLDRSIFVLRDELTTVMQELDSAKRTIREKEDEIRKLKRKSKQSYRTPMYGNDNIANMILKTLSNRGDSFPLRTVAEYGPQYNKCNHCDKVFLNQLYLKSHLQRRHSEFLDAPEKDSPETSPHVLVEKETKINSEIAELKQKLSEMESKLLNTNNPTSVNATATHEVATTTDVNQINNMETKDDKNKSNDTQLLDKIEEWKREESQKYYDEINKLRAQMIESINSIKSNEYDSSKGKGNLEVEQLNKTIIEQGEEIVKLKEELAQSDTKAVIEDANRKNIEAQVLLWTKKMEEQSVQYQRLLENLNVVAREAQEAKAIAEVESRRAANLQAQLFAKNKNDEKLTNSNEVIVDKTVSDKQPKPKTKNTMNLSRQPKPAVDRNSLEELHRKAQELLNIKSSSSSDSSRSSDVDKEEEEEMKKYSAILKGEKIHKNNKTQKNISSLKKKSNGNRLSKKTPKEKTKKTKAKAYSNVKSREDVIPPKSPQKLVRAKLTEEVNSRLVDVGVDPLKIRLMKSIYNKQFQQLQKEQRQKIKKNGKYEKARNSILVYLDAKVGKETLTSEKYPSSRNKTGKSKLSLSSMISNVKHKALSLVNVNTPYNKSHKNPVGEKKVMSARKDYDNSKTQDSPSSSPEKETHNIPELFKVTQRSSNMQSNQTRNVSKNLIKDVAIKPRADSEGTDDTDDTGTESDHDYDTYNKQDTKSIDNLIKSPIRRPATASGNYNVIKPVKVLKRAQSSIQLSPEQEKYIETRNSDVLNLDAGMRRNASDDNIQAGPKGVLKNAPSTSSLNKKKVLFDLDAIQMKSVSASPSQSTEKSDSNEKFELGLVNLDDEEWDISSIENLPLKSNEHSVRVSVASRASPKITELKESIESQLARRNPTPSTVVVGGVNVLGGPARAASLGGSNTSLGSSVFDTDADDAPPTSIKSKKIVDKDESDLDLSEFSIDGVINKNRGSFNF